MKSYFRIFLLSVATFLAILFILRFKEIARFSALSGNWTTTMLFTFYQFPLILPIAIPISSFLASFLLTQRLSQTSELTAFRACAFSFKTLFAPLFFASILIALANFCLCAEAAPFCRRESKSMLFRKTSENPLLLLQRQQLGKLKHSYLSAKIEGDGKKATNLFLLTYNERNDRLNFLWASRLILKNENLQGENVALISNYPTPPNSFDYLLVENQNSLSTKASVISQFLKKRHARPETTALSFRQLQLRYLQEGKKFSLIELFRRCSLSAAACSFTLLGFAFGIETGRTPSKRPTLIALSLLFALLISYLAAKELKKTPSLALSFIASTHLLIWVLSIWRLKRINKGLIT